jgi:predicted 3-demethylubiquinone-9 3-methyltransferase (glyoxalase superfamily)
VRSFHLTTGGSHERHAKLPPHHPIPLVRRERRLNEVRNTASDDPRLGPKGGIITIAFELDSQKFTALNGGPMFKFNESVSFVVRCDSQAEIDEYWTKLSSDGGQEGQCGWLKDKFGLSWQIVPARIPELVRSPKAIKAMMGMKKLIIAELERAAQP